MLDIREILRRFQRGQGIRAIARDLALSRKTIAKYQAWAEERGLLTGPLPEPGELQGRLDATLPVTPPPRTPSLAAPYRERIVALRQAGVECQAILQRLREETDFAGSYSAVWRYVRSFGYGSDSQEPETEQRSEMPSGRAPGGGAPDQEPTRCRAGESCRPDMKSLSARSDTSRHHERPGR